MIWLLARRELRSLFLSPLAWSVLAVIQVIIALLFLFFLEQYIEAQPRLNMMPDPPGVTETVVSRSRSSHCSEISRRLLLNGLTE